MLNQIRDWGATNKASSYAIVAVNSGILALTNKSLSFPLKIITSLAACQTAIHAGSHYLWPSRSLTHINTKAASLALLGNLGIVVTIAAGGLSALSSGHKLKRSCSLIMSLVVSRFLKLL